MKRMGSKLVMVMLLAGSLAGSTTASSASEISKVPANKGGLSITTSRSSRVATLTKRKWGVEVLGVHLTAAGYMMQFNYKVLDPKKAASLFDRRIKPYLVDTNTGAKFLVPSPEKVGQLRNVNTPEAGRIYWVLFANPGQMIKPGTQVDVVIGDFRASGLSVN
jgi:hypothetical protein